MAFVRSPNEKWQKDRPGGSNLYSEGAGGVAGGSGAVSNQSNNTSAGNAAGWYNIQDFLGANKGNQTMQNQIRDTGNQFVDQGKENMASEAAEYEGYERPELYDFDRGSLESTDIGAAQRGLGQDYDPFDVEGAINLSSDVLSPYENIQSGSVQSLTDFNKQGMKPNAQYTGGMQMMDNALLGSDYDFVNNYGNEFKSQFENEVINPFSEQKDNWMKAEADRDQAFDAAQANWATGIQDYLGNKQTDIAKANWAIGDTFDQRMNTAQTDPLAYADPETRAYIENQQAQAQEYGGELNLPTYEDYLRLESGNTFAPTADVGASTVMGGREGVDYWNALNSLYGDYTAGSETPWQAQLYNYSPWDQPVYGFDDEGFMEAARGGATLTESSMSEPDAAPASQDLTPGGPMPGENIVLSDPGGLNTPNVSGGDDWLASYLGVDSPSINTPTVGGTAGQVGEYWKKNISPF